MSHIKSKQNQQEPGRMVYAVGKIEGLGYEISHRDLTKIEFFHKGQRVTFYPYTGWATGKSIKDGRGVDNLLKQLEKQK